MEVLQWGKSAYRFLRLIHNARVSIKAEDWARRVQTLAHQFTAIEHDVRDGKYGSTQEIQRRIQATNGMTHGLWDDMQKELNIKK
ncbi:MAG: hypothetical protein G01um101438_874 [Parcubacteria group bacterium Gr01-1014_38]|nr:MAG: hypothetical protein G01um101438_874 [Parcubacteria group bacterium Gr01-1014_38]